MKIYHISDLHYTCDESRNRPINAKLADLYDLMGEDDRLLITGDLTDNGSLQEYDAALRGLSPWRERLLLVPGNHDYGWKGMAHSVDAAKRWKDLCRMLDAYGPPARPVATCGSTRVVLLDSNLHTSGLFPLDFARGRIRSIDMEMLERLGSASDQTQIVVALHHHPFPEPDHFGELTLRLENAAEFRRATWGVASRVCFGHRHHGPAEWHMVDSTRLRGEHLGRGLRNTVYQFAQSWDTMPVEEVVSWDA